MPLPSVLIVCSHFPPLNRTGGRRPYYLALALRNAGHRVSVLTSTGEGDADWQVDLQGIRVMRCPLTHVQRDMNGWQRLLAKAHHQYRHTFLHGPLRVLADTLLPEEHAARWDVLPEEVTDRLGMSDVVLATVPGWGPARAAYQLAKAWNATFSLDYRDPWTVADPKVHMDIVSGHGQGVAGWIRRTVYTERERKLGGAAYGLTAVSEAFLLNAQRITRNSRAAVFHGGFDPGIRSVRHQRNAKFTVVYTGRLYGEQDWELVLDALERLHRSDPGSQQHFTLRIVGGVSDNPALLRALREAERRTGMIETTPRMTREETIRIQQQADAVLHLSYRGRKGYLPVKYLEYLGSDRPIILITREQDLMEEVLDQTKTGLKVESSDALARLIAERVAEWRNGVEWATEPDRKALEQYAYPDCLRPWVVQINEWHSARTKAPLSK